MIQMHPEVFVAKLEQGDEPGFARVFELLQELHTETPHAPINLDKLREGLADTLANGIVIVSLTHNGDLAGTLGLCEDSPWFSDQRWLDDRWMFVHPLHRRTPHARCLIRAAKLLARDMGLPLQMTVTGYGARTAGKIRLFRSELGEPSGALWTVRPGR